MYIKILQDTTVLNNTVIGIAANTSKFTIRVGGKGVGGMGG